MTGTVVLFLAASIAQVDACEVAVHGDLASAEQICTPPREIDELFATDAMSGPCRDALLAGSKTGKNALLLPELFQRILIANFDKKLALCRVQANETKAKATEAEGDRLKSVAAVDRNSASAQGPKSPR